MYPIYFIIIVIGIYEPFERNVCGCESTPSVLGMAFMIEKYNINNNE